MNRVSVNLDRSHVGRYNTTCIKCGCSSVVELQLPKLTVRVRFPSPAPGKPAFIAQSVERIHGKDEVIGSIPIKGSTIQKAPTRGAFCIVEPTQHQAGHFYGHMRLNIYYAIFYVLTCLIYTTDIIVQKCTHPRQILKLYPTRRESL